MTGMAKPRKRRRYCCFHLIAVASLCLLTSIWADAVYLPTVGPAPLRFRADFQPKPRNFTLPPPMPAPPVASLPTPIIEKAVDTSAPTPTHDHAPATEQADEIGTAPEADEVVSTKMLLKYFNHSTNGIARGVKAPFEFIPPPAADSHSSKAEYSTPSH
jgi:hypothetical protein